MRGFVIDRGGVCEGEGFKMLMSKDHEVVVDIAVIGRWHETSKVFCEGGLKKAVSEIVRRDQVVFDQVEEFAGEEYHGGEQNWRSWVWKRL